MSPNRREFVATGLAAALAGAADGARRAGKPTMQGPIFNQDDSEFCAVRPLSDMTQEAIDAWVDMLANAGVGTLITCVGAMTTNYASKVWDARWSRYDPDGPDDQPVLRHLPADRIAGTRRWVENEKALADRGINLHQRAYDRCRQHGLGAWASIRMNDLHDCDLEDSPLLSTFYLQQRKEGKLRVPYHLAGWTDRALDWTRPEVREHYLKLAAELLETLDLDGLELDWMRFGYHFPPGRELAGGQLLTDWIGRVRGLCEKAAGRLGHPVKLGCRVPSHPGTARQLGLDGVAWARVGLLDLLVPTPFWATCEFDLPMHEWRRLVDGTGVTLAGGLECRYQPWRGGPATMMTPDHAAGAATVVLQRGADAVYLFNYFLRGHFQAHWTPEAYDATLTAMRSLDTLAAHPRRHALTFRDVLAPGEPAADPLPAVGGYLTFRVATGKKAGRQVTVEIEADPWQRPRSGVNRNSVSYSLAG